MRNVCQGRIKVKHCGKCVCGGAEGRLNGWEGGGVQMKGLPGGDRINRCDSENEICLGTNLNSGNMFALWGVGTMDEAKYVGNYIFSA